MHTTTCPCCNSRSLVLTMSLALEGYNVQGKCRECGYACDSAHVLNDTPDDLICEYSCLAGESLPA